MDHQYRDYLNGDELLNHLTVTHSAFSLGEHFRLVREPVTLAALNVRHRHEHGWQHIAPGLAPRPQDVDPMTESEYRALWGDK